MYEKNVNLNINNYIFNTTLCCYNANASKGQLLMILTENESFKTP